MYNSIFAGLDDLPCFLVFCLYNPYSNIKFLILHQFYYDNDTGLPSVTVAPSKDDNGVTFTATVDGVGKDKFTYKWKYNDEDINGETAHTLIITNPKESDEGEYVCVVSNEYKDEAKSKPVTLASEFDAIL